MKNQILLFILFSSSFLACNDGNSEIENLKKENTALIAQIKTLKSGPNANAPKYILKLRLRQSHFSLSIKKHIKDAVNSVDFEMPVDKEFFDSVRNGTEIIDNFRFGSFVLSGSFGDWELTVKDKIIR